MNYTEKYHLPQWEESDRVMRTDFNDAMRCLEEGIRRAQDSADERPYATGSYRGKGTSQSVNVGFTPRAVIVGPSSTVSISSDWSGCTLIVGSSSKWQIVENGFFVGSDNGTTHPMVNRDGVYYSYVAFR